MSLLARLCYWHKLFHLVIQYNSTVQLMLTCPLRPILYTRCAWSGLELFYFAFCIFAYASRKLGNHPEVHLNHQKAAKHFRWGPAGQLYSWPTQELRSNRLMTSLVYSLDAWPKKMQLFEQMSGQVAALRILGENDSMWQLVSGDFWWCTWVPSPCSCVSTGLQWWLMLLWCCLGVWATTSCCSHS